MEQLLIPSTVLGQTISINDGAAMRQKGKLGGGLFWRTGDAWSSEELVGLSKQKAARVVA
jgi:hypothetical protein